ncbi:uncharacterized protein LOC120799339 isoform X2 [Xiphias gladius]|uniref:uncharacterized protein LOC120799339 isoform X2 n=1 Tax=Xiphias gladius TaxID=8245 RepID=UPI001A983970|nr:uncharacterized protein LOC120799339 isoform X2 [Xiphias gladius]
MWRLQSLKVFINQRLTAAVEEVIGRLEKAITEYEEEMECRHRRLLDTASKPDDERRRAVCWTQVKSFPHLIERCLMTETRYPHCEN